MIKKLVKVALPISVLFFLALTIPFSAQSQCQLETDWTFDPPIPPSGAYDAGETIEICVDITFYSTAGANWLHGIEFDLHPAFDPTTIAVVNAPQPCAGGNGEWIYFDDLTCNGIALEPGFYYDVNSGGPQDGNPCNNFGDPCFANADWSFCFSVQLDPNCGGGNQFDGQSIIPGITVYGDGDTGSWGSSTNCTTGDTDGPNISTLELNCCDAESGMEPPVQTICENGNVDLITLLGLPVDLGGFWFGPPGWGTNGTGDPANGIFDPEFDPPGDYIYTTFGTGGCSNSSTITFEYNDIGSIQTIAKCSGGPETIESLLSPASLALIQPLGGTWYEPGYPGTQVVVPGGIVDDATSASGEYTYLFYDANNCLTTAAVEFIFGSAGSSGQYTEFDLCTEVSSFCPLDEMDGNPVNSGSWVIYQQDGTFVDFTSNAPLCSDDPNVTPGANPFDDFSLWGDTMYFVYALQFLPCPITIDTLQVNVSDLMNAGVFTQSTICVSDPPLLLESLLDGTVDFGFNWVDLTNGGVAVPNLFDPGSVPPNTTLQLQYSGGLPGSLCFNSALLELTVLPDVADAGLPAVLDLCETDVPFEMLDSLNGTPQSGGDWTDPNGNDVGDFFTPGLSIPGTYTYTIQSSCAFDDNTLTININNLPDAGVSAVMDICDDATNVDLFTGLLGTPQTGGTWSPGDPGGIVDGSTLTDGDVFTYTLGPPFCESSSQITVNLLNASNAGTLPNGPQVYCEDEAPFNLSTLFTTPPSVSDPNYWSGPGGFSGEILDPSTAQSGVYTYTIPDNGCGIATATVNISIETLPNAGANANYLVCPNDLVGIDLFTLLGGADAGGIWSPALNSGTGFFDPNIDPIGVYTYTVTSPGLSCQSSANVTITNQTLPNSGTSTSLDVCSQDLPFDLDLTFFPPADPGGTWTDPSNAVVNPPIYTPGSSQQGVYTYSIPVTGCPAVSSTVTISETPNPDPGTNATADVCQSLGLIDLTTYLGGTPEPGGTWFDQATGAVSNPYDISAGIGQPCITLEYIVSNGGCTSMSALTLCVEAPPEAGLDVSETYCADGSNFVLDDILDGSAQTGGTWSPTGNFTLTSPNAGVYTYEVVGTACPPDQATYTIDIFDELSVIDVVTLCEPSQTSYTISFTVNGGEGAYNVGIPGTFSGNIFTSDPLDIATFPTYNFNVDDAGVCDPVNITGNAPNCVCPATASFVGGNQNICAGDVANLQLDLFGQGPFVVDYDEGATPQTATNVFDGDVITVSPIVTTTYTLTDVSDANCVGTAAGSITVNVEQPVSAGPDVIVPDICQDGSILNLNDELDLNADPGGTWTPSGSIALIPANSGVYSYEVSGVQCPADQATYTINIIDELSISNLQAVCQPNQTEYVISFSINGGQGPFSVGIAGTLTGNTFTSDPLVIATDPTYNFNVVDDSGLCPAVTISGNAPNCSCPATASFVGGTQTICAGDVANLELDLAGQGPFTVGINEGVNPLPPESNLFDGDVITVSPSVTTTYTLTSVSDANCDGTVVGSITVNVEQPVSAGPDIVLPDFCADGSNLNLNAQLTSGADAGGSWSPAANIALIPANSGVYTYEVSGAQCPADQASYTVNIIEEIAITNLQAVCEANQTQYTISFTILNGQPPYTVDGVPGTLSGSTFTSDLLDIVGFPTYDIDIDDSGICPEINISGNAPNCNCPATASFVGGTQNICSGDVANLELDLAGQGPFTVGINEGLNPLPPQSNLFDGDVITVSPSVTTTYTLTSVSDANCDGTVVGSITVNVEQPVSAGPNVTVPDICSDGSTLVLNDLLDLSATGGGSWSPSGSIPLIPANSGNYTYEVSGTQCPADQAVYTINIDQEISISNLQAVCEPSQTEYTITFTINGGVPPYFADIPEAIISGNSVSATIDFDANPDFDITISDSGVCDDIVVSGIAPDCNCTATGSLTSAASAVCFNGCTDLIFNLGGNGPFDVVYVNDNNPGNQLTLSGISDGHTLLVCPQTSSTYTLISVDDQDCSGVVTGAPISIQVDQPLQISNIQEVCDVTNENFTVQFTVTGGIPGTYNFTPFGGSFDTNTNLYTSPSYPSGSAYSINVSDAGACPDVAVESSGFSCGCLTEAGNLLEQSFEVCDGETVSVTSMGNEVLDGNDLLRYVLHNGTATTIGDFSIETTVGEFIIDYGIILPSPFEEWYIHAVAGNDDGTGFVDLDHPCTSLSNGVPATFNPTPSANIAGSAAVCEGSEVNLEINLTGTPPFNVIYALDGVAQPAVTTSDNEFMLPVTDPGTYTLLSMDDGTCSGVLSGSAVISNFETPTATLTGEPEVCENSGDGPEVAFTGQGPWTYEYAIDGENQGSLTSNFPNVTIPAEENGTYQILSVSDVNCPGTVSGSLAVTVLDQPEAVITGGGVVCQGDEATFDVALTGTGPFILQYTVNGFTETSPPITGNNFSFSAGIEGTYGISTITDANCSGQSASTATLDVNPLPEATVTSSEPIFCLGQEVQLTLDFEGNAPFEVTYVLNDDTIQASNVQNDILQTLTPTEAVNLTVISMTDGSNPTCSSEPMSSIFVDLVELPNAPVLTSDTICEGNGAVNIGVQPSPGLTYQWSPDDFLSDAASSNPEFNVIGNPPFTTTYQYILTASNENCSASDTMTVTVDPGPRARFTYSPDPILSEDPLVHFINRSIARDSTMYTWEFDTLDTSDKESPWFRFPDGVVRNYNVSLTAIDPLTGCISEYSEIVEVQPQSLIFIPNAFTPDGDGTNDLWGPVMTNISEDDFQLSVYNRLGELIFRTVDPNKKWNGSMNPNGGDESGYYVEPGLYVWKLDAKNGTTLDEIEMTGHVIVIR